MSVLPQIGNKVSLAQRAYEIIRDAIITNKFKPGQMLIEENLARELAISRTPVRSALKMLAREHLIITNSSRNVIVAEVTRKDIKDVMDVRKPLESLAAGIAASKMNPAGIMQLEAIVESQMGAMSQNDTYGFIHNEYRFHTFIGNCTGNPWLCEMIEDMNTVVRRHLILSSNLESVWEKVPEEHGRIIEAIELCDAARAEMLMTGHIENAGRNMLR